MTVQETAKVFKVLQGAYPNWKPSKDTLAAWAALFTDEPLETVMAGVKAFIACDTKGFAPSIGQIKEVIHTPPCDMTESEAWALVRKAISNGIYGYEEEFKGLPAVVQKAVGSPMQIHHWAMLTEGIDTVVASFFTRNYRMQIERLKTESALPVDVKKALGLDCGINTASIADVRPNASAELLGDTPNP